MELAGQTKATITVWTKVRATATAMDIRTASPDIHKAPASASDSDEDKQFNYLNTTDNSYIMWRERARNYLRKYSLFNNKL